MEDADDRDVRLLLVAAVGPDASDGVGVDSPPTLLEREHESGEDADEADDDDETVAVIFIRLSSLSDEERFFEDLLFFDDLLALLDFFNSLTVSS